LAWVRLGRQRILCHLIILEIVRFAVDLIKKGLAYVDDQPADVISNRKGLYTVWTRKSFQRRSVDENLDLFQENETL